MDKQIFFSVIIPSFNRKDFLKTAVDSVLKQTYKALELIIIDDGSDDGTDKLISGYNDTRIIYKYQPNLGVSKARNTGLDIASGDFIAFLDSDDRWKPEKLERTIDYIRKFPGIHIFHTDEIWFRGGKLLNQRPIHKKPTGKVYKNALPLCCISISTAVIKRDVFKNIGIFDKTLEACEDYDFWLRATNKYEIRHIPEDLTIKDGGRPDQLSSSVWGLDRFRIKALEKMLLSGQLSDERYKATLSELKKKCRIFATGAGKRGKTEEAEYYLSIPKKYDTEDL